MIIDNNDEPCIFATQVLSAIPVDEKYNTVTFLGEQISTNKSYFLQPATAFVTIIST